MTDPYVAEGVELPCPRCAHVFPATVRLVIELGRTPDAGPTRLVCPRCGTEFTASAPVLIHDGPRQRAWAFVPEAVADADEVVTGLLARWLRGAGGAIPGEYLLEPVLYRSLEALAAAVTGAETGPDEPSALAPAIAFCRQSEAEPLARVLEALAEVRDLPQFLALANDLPELLDPVTVAGLTRLAEQAEDPAIAGPLADVAALLREHLPEVEDDPAEESVPRDIREALQSGDLEAAAEYLERPAPPTDDEFRRAMLNTLEPDLREGFADHARLFGGLLEGMLDDAVPGLPAEPAPLAIEPLEGLDELLAAVTIDQALEVLARRRELVTPEAVARLRELEARALDEGDDALASHLELLVNTIYVSAEDEDWEETDDGTPGR